MFPLQWTNAEGETSHGYREDGYFPEAFVNLLAMLGWNPGDERELFSLDELVEAFSLEKVQKAGAKFNPDKAKWYNREYLRRKTDEELSELLVPVLAGQGITVSGEAGSADFKKGVFPRGYVRDAVTLVKERATFVKDLWTAATCLFKAPEAYVQKDADKFWKPENSELALQAARYLCEAGIPFEKELIGPALEEYIRGNEWPMGKVMNCLRLALTGASSGLGIADILSFIGKDEFRRRIEAAAERLG